MNITDINFDKLIKNAVKDKYAITITVNIDNIEIHAEPWKPFEMKCPYEHKENMEEK